MLICPNCKKELADGESFCDACGTALTDVAAQEAKNENEATEAAATETAAKKSVGDIAKELLEKAKQIPKKWLMIGAGAIAGLIVVIILASLLFGPAKPNFDLEDAADNLEDEDYYVSYSDDEDELSVGTVEKLTAYDDDNFLYVTVYATKKLADMAYEELKLELEREEEDLKREINHYKYLIKKFEDELDDRDKLDYYEEVLEELEDELEELKDSEYVFGQSGKKVWYGTKDAIKDSKG